MTIIIEIDGPFQHRPGKFESRIMTRYWWLWFAITFLKIPLWEYSSDDYEWRDENEWE